MKKVLLGFAICLFTSANSFSQEHKTASLEESPVNWEATYKRALKNLKKKTNQSLFILRVQIGVDHVRFWIRNYFTQKNLKL